MKQSQLTLLALLFVFVMMIGLLAVQSAQKETKEIPPTHETLRDNDVQLGSGLLFPEIQAKEVVMINILDPVLKSQVTIMRSPEDEWQVSDNLDLATNQDYANSLAVTLEKIPFTTQIGVSSDNQYDSYGLNEQDALIVVSAVLRDKTWHTMLVGNPVSTDNTTQGFYTVVDDREIIYITPPQPVLYLVQYLEAYENSQKLDN